MALRLSIVSRHGPQLGTDGVKEFGPEGGTIGRSLECDWPLPDAKRYLSSRHASIDFRSGTYYIVDTSMNGVYVNDAEQPVGRGKPQRLFSGDRLRFGEYEISVEIDDDPISTLIDENHVDPVDLAQRVEAPAPTGEDLVDAYEITGVGIEMMLTDDELETLTPPPRSRGSFLEIVDDGAKTRTPSSPAASRQKPPAPTAGLASTLPAAAKRPALSGFGAAKPARTPSPSAPPSTAASPVIAATLTSAGARNETPAWKPAAPNPAAKAPPRANASAPPSTAPQTPRLAPASVHAQNSPPTRTAAPAPAPARGAKAPSAPKTASAARPATVRAADSATERAAAKTPAPQRPMPPAAAQKAVPLPAAPSAAAVLGLDPKAPTPATPAQAQPTPLHSSRVPDLEPFFRGARVSARVPPQQVDAFLFRLGQVMRAVMIGITGGLSSCAEQKNALRLPSTTSEPQHNNPLKHSAGADKAFASLLLADSSSHLAPVDAVREAFEELQLHQQLMLKALRSAVDAFVARLDPDELEQKFARGRANVLVNAANRLKYWEFYKDLYDVVAHHPPGELPLQFVEDFTEAYGRELARTSDAPAETPEKRQAV